MSVLSKLFTPMPVTCQEYVHPWTPSCYTASAGLLLHALQASFRLYVTVYALALLMKGRKPSGKDIKRTIYGILQSTAFIGCHAVGFSLCTCLMRNLFGHYNFFTFAFLPTFVSSWFAILVERPSRRSLLSLYVTNIASETLYQMLVWRKIVKPVPFTDVIIFTASISCLMYFYRREYKSTDSIYSLIRCIIGPYEQLGYNKGPDSPKYELPPREFAASKDKKSRSTRRKSSSVKNLTFKSFFLIFELYKQFKNHVQTILKSDYCTHPHGCLYYWLQGGSKVFAIGYGLQLSLKILMHFKKIIRRPILLLKSLKNQDTFRLGAFIGGFCLIYRFISCTLRRQFKKDTPSIAIPAAFTAGFTFWFYRSNTIALYVMWKSLQILYLAGLDNNVLPEVPYASIFFHCLSTAVLFQAAIFEPQNLRSSYWSFLHNMSGGRILYFFLSNILQYMRSRQNVELTLAAVSNKF